MEILNNFSSIYCFITFIMGAVFMFIAVCVVAMGKDKEPRNKVRFFVERITYHCHALYIKSNDGLCGITTVMAFKKFGLNPDDFADMKVGEIREVFINLED